MLRELAEAVEVLTTERPLVFVLEDLHWSDHATLDWLAFVARRREPARFLVLATYRPADAIVRSHPVRTVSQELQRQGHSVNLTLDYLPEGSVATYLSQRLRGVSLPSDFVQRLHHRTSGNPFFLVTIVEALIQQGALVPALAVEDPHETLALMAIEVPDSIQHLLNQQLDALSAEGRALLETASVVGAVFSAAAIAGDLAVEDVDAQCAALARNGQFIEADGVASWPDGMVSGRYRFTHALYQETLYHGLLPSQRMRLHRQIGERVEAGYGAQARDLAAQLSSHFAQGRDTFRAVQYAQYAGENALRRSAHREAIGHFRTALEMLAELPDTPDRAQQELTLLLALGPALNVTRGDASSEVEQTYVRAQALCQTRESAGASSDARVVVCLSWPSTVPAGT